MIEKTTLEKKSRKYFDWRPILAFFLTMFSFVLVFMINRITPFGQRDVLTSDLGAQYGPYLMGLRQALLDGQSLLYSPKLGMGANTMGIFAYYLSSPLNILVLFFPASRLQEMITLLIILKLSFCGAFMTFLLDRKFKTKDNMTILFGMMFPFCSFAIIYIFNIMWLDGLALLPLLILLTEQFVENKRKWPALTALLLLLFVSGYYMAYMIGIFSFIYLVSYMGYYGHFSKEKQKEGLKKVGMFILSAVVAGMMSAAILIPAGLNTLGNPDYQVSGGMSMEPEFSWIAVFDQLVEKNVDSLATNPPFIFCGVAALLLCILFFLNPSIKKTLKTAIGSAFGFGLLCFQFPMLNRAWHLFDDPNWFNFRYSYLFSFVMILVAFYSYLNMGTARKKDFFCSFGIVCGISVISQSFGLMGEKGNTFFATLIFSLLVTVLLYGKTLEKWPESIYNLKKFGTVFLAAVIVVEIVVFNPRCFMPKVFSGRSDADNFSEMIADLEELSGKIEDTDWFRTEIHMPWHDLVDSNNLPFYMNRQGISIFASMANKKTDHFLKQLGYCSNYNYFALDHLNVVLPADSVLGIRYIVTTHHDLRDLEYRNNVQEYYLYKNPYAVGAALMAQPGAAGFDGFALEKNEVDKDYFTFQENWITSLSGLDAADIYETFTEEWELFNGQETQIPPTEPLSIGDTIMNTLNSEKINMNNENIRYFLRSNDKAPMVLSTTFKAERSGSVYFVIPYMYIQCNTNVYVNGERVGMEEPSSSYSQILDLGYFDAGEEVKVEIRVKSDVIGFFEPLFAYLNEKAIEPHMAALSTGLESVAVENGHYTVKTSSGEDRLLILTVPYEKGWEATVDGQKVEIQAYQNAFLSIPLSAGSHTVELRFTPPGWKAGLAASALGILLFAALSILILRKKEEKGAAAPSSGDTIEKEESEKKTESAEAGKNAEGAETNKEKNENTMNEEEKK